MKHAYDSYLTGFGQFDRVRAGNTLNNLLNNLHVIQEYT